MEDPQFTVPSISTKGWTLDSVLEQGSNFVPIERVHANDPNIDLEQVIKGHEENGVPLILDGWHKRRDWPKDLFTLDFFQRHSPKDIHVRNVHDWQDSVMPLDDFITASRANPPCAPRGEQIRMYGKDAECPKDWSSWIKTGGVIPEVLHWNGSNDYFRYRPKNALVQTLMCYAGIGDTFTPAHKDLCASSGQNLMCHTEMNGSSFWFMTKGSDAAEASEFFQTLGQELDHEAHVISLKELAKAPFTVYVAEQGLGDLVLVPPRSCHQVVNFGGITLKTSWSRMTLEGLITAYYHELPIYQRVCRPETYRIKSTIFCALRAQTKELEQLHPGFGRSTKGKKKGHFTGKPNSKSYALIQSLRKLVAVFREIVAQEYSGKDHKTLAHSIGELNDEETMEHRLVCDFCGGDIFQAFFECGTCVGVKDSSGNADQYTICPACYADGRSCHCLTMQPRHCFSHKELCRVVEQADKILSEFDPEWSKNREELDADYSVFKAACHLIAQRTTKYICYHDKELAYGMSCKHKKGCHNSRCFRHLLERCHMHSVQALSVYYKNVENYHPAHQQSIGKYAESKEAVEESQRLGSNGPIDMLRVHYALKYRSCRPLAAERSRGGFYDTEVQNLGEFNCGEGMLISPPYTASVASSEDGSTTNDVPLRAAVVITTRTKRKPIAIDTSPTDLHTNQERTQPSSRRRVFVNVPPAPYPVNAHSMATTSTRIGPPRRKRITNQLSKAQPLQSANAAIILEEEERPQSQEEALPSELGTANPAPQDADVDMDAFADQQTQSVSSPSPSASIKRHRFPSGMVVNLEYVDPLPFAAESLPSPPSRSPPRPPMLPTKARSKRKQLDLGTSLADAMNQANARNSEMLESLPRKRKRPAQIAIDASEAPSQDDSVPADAEMQDPLALVPQLMQQVIVGMAASGLIDAGPLDALRQAADDKSSEDPTVKARAEATLKDFVPVFSAALTIALRSQDSPTMMTGDASDSSQLIASQSTLSAPKDSSLSAQRNNAVAGPSKPSKKQKHSTSLSAPVLPRLSPLSLAPGPPRSKPRTRPSVSSSRAYTSISSSSQVKRKGKGKETEQAGAKSRSRLSQASRMSEDKDPSPKTRDKMFSALSHEVMRTRIPKVVWKPESKAGTSPSGVPFTSSTSSVSSYETGPGSRDAVEPLAGAPSNVQGSREGEEPILSVSASVDL